MECCCYLCAKAADTTPSPMLNPRQSTTSKIKYIIILSFLCYIRITRPCSTKYDSKIPTPRTTLTFKPCDTWCLRPCTAIWRWKGIFVTHRRPLLPRTIHFTKSEVHARRHKGIAKLSSEGPRLVACGSEWIEPCTCIPIGTITFFVWRSWTNILFVCLLCLLCIHPPTYSLNVYPYLEPTCRQELRPGYQQHPVNLFTVGATLPPTLTTARDRRCAEHGGRQQKERRRKNKSGDPKQQRRAQLGLATCSLISDDRLLERIQICQVLKRIYCKFSKITSKLMFFDFLNLFFWKEQKRTKIRKKTCK